MCTAINFTTKDHYFGRNLDLDCSYGEAVTITPRNYPFQFRKMGEIDHHYAIIGMAHVADGYPLYYDATNEKGVSMAGLRFAGNAHYPAEAEGKDNVSPFEFIPWVLCRCGNLQEVKKLLERVNLMNHAFSEELSLTPLHWMISCREESLVVEAMADGLHVYENPVGVMTNNPPFPVQLWNLENTKVLPGDLDSPSRFVRAARVLKASVCGVSEEESVGQFFHILTAVEQQQGCNRMESGRYELTVYSSCCNADKGIYYYTTYGNRQITAVDMHREDLEADRVGEYPLRTGERFFFQNTD